MIIQWQGKNRVHIEGIGYVAPGGEVDVLESVGHDLCSGGEFKEVQSPKSKVQSRKTKRQKHRAAEDFARQEEV